MPVIPVSTAGESADAVAARDFERIHRLLDNAIDFRGMTPRRIWEADGPDEVVAVLRGWLARGRTADGPMLFEQQAYVREQGGRVISLRVICSGPRPR